MRYNLDTDTLKIGILSDLQLEPKGESDKYDESFRKTLEFFKANDVQMIINIGDYTDTALKKSYENYQRIYQSVYGENSNIIPSFILGNHDYWLPNFVDCWEIPFKSKMISRFEKYTGEISPWTHKVVNGYHFIAVSPDNGKMDDEAYSKKHLNGQKRR
ncbi:MAG: metallophosphoesterase [Clostridiales bacterium]|nr:metallophosphoesterase [Clostridiales bacterium]